MPAKRIHRATANGCASCFDANDILNAATSLIARIENNAHFARNILSFLTAHIVCEMECKSCLHASETAS